MNKEEEIQQELIKNFNFPEDKIRIPKERRIFVDVSMDKFEEVLKFLMDKIHFDTLCTITGLDEGDCTWSDLSFNKTGWNCHQFKNKCAQR